MFPYQCSYYLQLQELTTEGSFNETSFLRFNLILNAVKILAIYASFPYWKMLGLI